MAKRFNIRMAGVGGQGVVTGSHILSTAVINAGGRNTLGFPIRKSPVITVHITLPTLIAD